MAMAPSLQRRVRILDDGVSRGGLGVLGFAARRCPGGRSVWDVDVGFWVSGRGGGTLTPCSLGEAVLNLFPFSGVGDSVPLVQCWLDSSRHCC